LYLDGVRLAAAREPRSPSLRAAKPRYARAQEKRGGHRSAARQTDLRSKRPWESMGRRADFQGKLVQMRGPRARIRKAEPSRLDPPRGTKEEPVELFVGIDVSKAVLDIAVHPTGEVWSVANSTEGVKALV
jgi:hypothetical protein